ncbi:hypothetical protein PHSY_001916 [Pseudozyma hubeiensis SY62]|uniref:F-box domain-containing protein n=1 Tax=Pseudozyma hubeiensis (strain SY62) TaxID=1305764 RepID=R9P8G1_PSEHS|nr:hypothetical protein PHSY_001916 [Pseudozyma hubeiensis SY62]GAC94345.1 hypothetical protein PHSY_001916 [Pseudozyma hubeiensis SY62]
MKSDLGLTCQNQRSQPSQPVNDHSGHCTECSIIAAHHNSVNNPGDVTENKLSIRRQKRPAADEASSSALKRVKFRIRQSVILGLPCKVFVMVIDYLDPSNCMSLANTCCQIH